MVGQSVPCGRGNLSFFWFFNVDIVLLNKTGSRAVKSREIVSSFCEWIWFRCSERDILNMCSKIYPQRAWGWSSHYVLGLHREPQIRKL